jgi:hypothetical protein
MKELKAKLKEIEKARKKFAEEAVGCLKEVLKGIMEEHPEVLKIRWRQYAPYFNDGERCEFGIHTLCAMLKGREEYDGDYGEGFISAWELDDEKPAEKRIGKVLQALEDAMEGMLPELEAAFGNDAEITVTPKKIEVEEYTDHD